MKPVVENFGCLVVLCRNFSDSESESEQDEDTAKPAGYYEEQEAIRQR